MASSTQFPTIIDTAKCTHVFPNFTSRDAVWWTVEFSPPTMPSHCFHLGIYPKNSWDDFKKDIFCCLWISPNDNDDDDDDEEEEEEEEEEDDDENQTELAIQYRVSILDGNGMKHCTKEVLWNYVENSKWGRDHSFIRLISRKNLLDPKNGLLKNGQLTIYCEVDVLSNQIPHISDESKSNLSSNTQTDFKSLLENPKFSDVVLVVGKREFRAHKNILAARSRVFDEMFEETDDDDDDETTVHRVTFKNIDAQIFQLMLRYIYSGTVGCKLDAEGAMELLIAADKYQLEHLKSICAQSLSSNLTVDTVSYILHRADRHSAPQLKVNCIKFIKTNSKKVMQTAGWKQLFKVNPDLINELIGEFAKAR